MASWESKRWDTRCAKPGCVGTSQGIPVRGCGRRSLPHETERATFFWNETAKFRCIPVMASPLPM
eukprot:4601017-Prymnesium_polylepis.2